jgi:hypothetical protein
MSRHRLPIFSQRQDDSLRLIRKSALVDGFLLSGRIPFTPIQRIGAVILGMLPLVLGILALQSSLLFDSSSDADSPATAGVLNLIAHVWLFVLGAVLTIFGARVILNAPVKRSSATRSHK